MNNWDQYHQSTPKLLPPTVFEKTSDSLPTQQSDNDFFSNDSQILQFTTELEKLKNEIRKLHTENETLRNRNKDFIEQAQLYTEVSEHRKISITALEELVHKQTKEIQNLKTELQNEKEKNSNHVQNLDNNYKQQIQDLTEENRLLSNGKKDLELELKNLLNENSNLKCLNEKITLEKDHEIENLLVKNEKITLELNNLKAYVENSMPTIQTANKMNDELTKLKNDNLNLNLRLKSLNEILQIQENQMESSSGGSMEKKKVNLLTKWRQKVYELLIQLKSQELYIKQEKCLCEKKLQSYEQKYLEESAKSKILEHVVEDKKAELTIMASDVSQLKEKNTALEKQRDLDLQSSLELKNFVDEIIKNYQLIEESFKMANKKLDHLDQRVEFAKNRLGVIKALYSSSGKKETPKEKNMLEMTSNLSSIHSVDDVLIRNELKKVCDERDLLANRLQNDVGLMNDKISDMKNEYELMITNLNSELKELRLLDMEREAKFSIAEKKLEEKSNLYEELNKRYEELSERFKSLKNELTMDNEKLLREREDEFMNKLSKMNEKLNEARREQAKAVVLMRQMERSTNREKDRMENLLKSCDSYYKEHVKNLQDKLISLEKEKNILMNSLRVQGGLFVDSKEHEVTSFWLDSKQQIEVDSDEEQSQIKTNKELDLDEELNTSDMNKNTEILQQIRRIMGNLELSDVDDEEDDDNNSQNESVKNKDESLIEKIDDNDKDERKELEEEEEGVYEYDIEHAIDDIINKKNQNSY
ncbi:unnamed protein product [Brachionus calyciflorus]|uniref:Coiled-coil alpha-helical rod protein 1 n=1 Tax=Brachionus calyciflorus TaxID=104777 RepID=A0A813WB29_9BILA|nr:unnamed protein product [Brachionus calyciflorus]